MNDTIISVETLGKKYNIQYLGEKQRYVALRDVLAEKTKRLFSRGQRAAANRHTTELPSTDSSADSCEDFWALKDVSFEVKRGEVVGIIGRNGAGKSTLLKILSRITEPTAGRVRLKGRVASLLEVGTGFHPELTGRENIFLNGSILGMSRSEIIKKFDEIVAFAEVEKFLDMPVKRYSSGMYVRLAFAVAAHLEPEILIVDEVLAVGDLQFQKKCLGKMQDVAAKEGRTVLFVSHNMSAITRLCSQGILVSSGHMIMKSDVNSVVSCYLNSMNEAGNKPRSVKERRDLLLQKKVFIGEVRIHDQEMNATEQLDVRHSFYIIFDYEIPRELQNIEMAVRIETADGRAVVTTLLSDSSPEALRETKLGAYEAAIEFPGMFFMPGEYLVNVAAHEPMGEIFDVRQTVARFTIQDTGSSFVRYQNYEAIGVVMLNLDWQQRHLAST
ncbi:MAG TPA: ABC transporter ATP-binding protein [Verrucomicrobiae bacterium]|jgi:lipopolysaccharide transport system ATP-binding protein